MRLLGNLVKVTDEKAKRYHGRVGRVASVRLFDGGGIGWIKQLTIIFDDPWRWVSLTSDQVELCEDQSG